MKIGILNFYYSNNNYGAVLQAYALRNMIKGMGYEAEIINFRNSPYSLKALVDIYKKYKEPDNPFEAFRRNHLGIKKFGLFFPFQLKSLVSKYDAFVVGSDQVWRPDHSRIHRYFFYLSFVPDDKLKISYAASFGKDYWDCQDKEYTRKAKQLIQRFDAISLREKSGCDICQDLFKVDCSQVLDPVLLGGEDVFKKITNPQSHKSRVVYYLLDKPSFKEDILEIAEASFQEKPVNIHFAGTKGAPCYYDVEQWLDYIRDADLIITDSFHCICFSIIFKKKFICVLNEKRGVARLKDLFSDLSISGCIYDGTNFNSVIENTIDYNKVDSTLKELRDKSYNFLKQALSINQHHHKD